MRRAAALLLVLALLFALCACAPDNVLTPQPEDADEGQQTENEPESQPETEPGDPEPADDESLTDGAKYLAAKKENKGVVPTLKFDGSQTLDALTETVRLSIFVDDGESFWNIDERKWMEDVAGSYKIALTVKKRPAATLFPSQLISVRAGLPLDIIYCRAENCAAPLTLMQSIADLASPEGDEPYIRRAFELSGYKMMLPGGGCKALWYDKTKVNGDPLAEYFENVWTLERLAQYADRPLAAAGWLPFASAGAPVGSGIGEEGWFVAEDGGAYSAIKAFAALSGSAEPLFTYALSPDKKLGQNCAVPIPRVGGDGRYAVSFAGGAMGLSVTSDAEKRQAAAAFIKLWCTRAAEARTDALIYGAGLTSAEADAFMTVCDTDADLYEFDGEINRTFGTDAVSVTPDAAGNYAEQRRARLDILNARR